MLDKQEDHHVNNYSRGGLLESGNFPDIRPQVEDSLEWIS